MPIPAAQVTTTNSIEGWTVTAHLGVVAAHVVAGTGVFSDIFAGFSDFFGGRSGAYQAQLASVYEEAVAKVRQQGQARGGNWIIGLSIDADEISGKNMQMFMVTATGTVVSAERSSGDADAPSGGARSLTPADLAVTQRRLQLSADLNRIPSELGEEQVWTFIVEHHVAEVLPGVLMWLGRRTAHTAFAQLDQSDRQRVVAYMRSLDPVVVREGLYQALRADEDSARGALVLLQALPAGDLATTMALLEQAEGVLRFRALQTLRAQQPRYGAQDLVTLDKLIDMIPDLFPRRDVPTTSKGLLGSKRRWACGFCGHQENSEDATECSKCDRDPSGFRAGELTAVEAVRMLGAHRKLVAAALDAAGT